MESNSNENDHDHDGQYQSNAAYPRTNSKQSLSKFGPFNVDAIKHTDSDAEEYGDLDPSFVSEKKLKKSLSKYGSRNLEHAVAPEREDEDYGQIDPNYHADRVAMSSSGQYIVIPDSASKKSMKKTLSKYGTPQSVKSPKSPGDSDDEYASPDGKKKPKKLNSQQSPKHSTYVFDDTKKISFQNMQLDSDEEDYGQVDPSYHAENVVVTQSGHYTVAPESQQNSEKVIKKTLSKYGSPGSLLATPVKATPVKTKEEEDEDYGQLDPTFHTEPVALTSSGHYTVVSESTPSSSGKVIKKTLSKYGTPSSEKMVSSKKSQEDDEDYGEIDPNFHSEKITVTQSGHYVVASESTNSSQKGLKKTLSKYGSPSTGNAKSSEAISALRSEEDEEYGDIDPTFHSEKVVLTQSGHYTVAGSGKSMKKTLSKFGSQSSEQIVEERGIKLEDDEEYGEIDPTYHAENVSVTKSGHYVVEAESSTNTPPKKMVKTLSKYKQDMHHHSAPSVQELLKKEDDNEDYGNDIDPNYLEPSQKVPASNGVTEKDSGNHSLQHHRSIPFREAYTATPEPRENQNRPLKSSRASSTENLDMSLDGLLASSPQKEKAVVQLVTEEEKDNEAGHQTNLPTVFSQDINDNETPYEVKLVYLVEKGYTRDQAEELIRTTSSPNAKARHDHQNVVHHQSQQHLSATDDQNSRSIPPEYSHQGSSAYSIDPYYYQQQQLIYNQMIPAHQSPLPSQSNTIDQEEIDALVSKGYTVEQAIAVCQTSRSTSHDNHSAMSVHSQPHYMIPPHPMYVPIRVPPVPAPVPPPQPAAPPRFNPYMPYSPLNYVQSEDEQALRIAMLVSEQEAEFGFNMYQVVTAEADEVEIQALTNRGFSVDEAILWIFEKRGYKLKKTLDQENFYAAARIAAQLNENSHTRRSQGDSGVEGTSVDQQQAPPVERSRSNGSQEGLSPANKKKLEQRKGSLAKMKMMLGLSRDSAEDDPQHQQQQLQDQPVHKNLHVTPPRTSKSRSTFGSFFTSNPNNDKTPEEKELQKLFKYRDADVKILTELGFTKEQAIQALIENNHNVSVATNVLVATVAESELRKSRENINYQPNKQPPSQPQPQPYLMGLNPYSYPYPSPPGGVYYPHSGSASSYQSMYYPSPPGPSPYQSNSMSMSRSYSGIPQSNSASSLSPTRNNEENIQRISSQEIHTNPNNESFYSATSASNSHYPKRAASGAEDSFYHLPSSGLPSYYSQTSHQHG